jgi:hypothetical protein
MSKRHYKYIFDEFLLYSILFYVDGNFFNFLHII